VTSGAFCRTPGDALESVFDDLMWRLDSITANPPTGAPYAGLTSLLNYDSLTDSDMVTKSSSKSGILRHPDLA
jgi:hypothetical protein